MAITFIQLLCPFNINGQGNNVTDSLYHILGKSKKKAGVMNEIAYEFQHILPSEALKISLKALEISEKEKNEKEKGNAFFNLAIANMALGNYYVCDSALTKAAEIYKRLDYKKGILQVENAQANLIFMYGNLKKAMILFQENLTATKNENFEELQITNLSGIGRICWMQGEYKQALEKYNTAKQLAFDTQNKYLLGMIYLFTGIVYQDMGFYELAVENMQNSLMIFEKMNYYTKLPYALNYLGSVYYDFYEYDNAYKYITRAIEIFDKTGDTWGMALSCRFLGRIYKAEFMLDSAQHFFDKSLSLAKQLNDQSGELYSRRFLGEVFIDQGKYEKAAALFNENLQKSYIEKNMQEKVNNLCDLGVLYLSRKQYTKALKYLHESAILADSLHLFYENMIINKHIAKAYEQSGNYKTALYYVNIFKSLSDSIFSDKKRKNIEELQLKYETEKKNNEISQLRIQQLSQQTKIKQQRIISYSMAAGLILVIFIVLILWHSYNHKKKANHEKEVLLKEIHHRVKNNLQTISSLLSLQGSYVADERIKDAVRESQGRVKSMALIHQMLYQQDHLSKINFGKYIHQLHDAISGSYLNTGTNVKYIIKCEDVELDIDTAIPLGLIANELIINAYKYAFNNRDNGIISVSLNGIEKNKYSFVVKDNGKGITQDFKIENTNTLGLKLVYLLVRQIRGEIQCKVENGTEFRIIFEDIQGSA
jgi:two-component sensor histidine kinase